MGSHVRVYEVELSGVLTKENRHRLERVMRLREGDNFIIANGNGQEAEAVLGPRGTYQANGWINSARESSLEVTLFAAVSKGEKFDWMVEKAVELGVRRIVPIISRHCVVKKPSDAKVDRWQKIALSAMLQCGGCILPEITEPVVIEKIPSPESDTRAMVLFEVKTDDSLKDFHGCNQFPRVWLFTGPEGGFAREEIDALTARGWRSVYLGKRIFRAETAPLLALANIMAGSWGTD